MAFAGANLAEGCNSAGLGVPKEGGSTLRIRKPITQERPPSKSRNSTARTSAARSPQNERTAARLSEPDLSVATRKMAARVSGAATACARAGDFSAASGTLIGSVFIGCRSRRTCTDGAPLHGMQLRPCRAYHWLLQRDRLRRSRGFRISPDARQAQPPWAGSGPSTNTLHLAHSTRLCSLNDERCFVVDDIVLAVLSVNFVLLHGIR